MKDHEKRELVSRITAVALEYRAAEQLRERIGEAVLPAIDAAVAAERERFTTPEAMAEHALLYAAFDGAPSAATPADALGAARLLFGDAAVEAALAKYRRA